MPAQKRQADVEAGFRLPACRSSRSGSRRRTPSRARPLRGPQRLQPPLDIGQPAGDQRAAMGRALRPRRSAAIVARLGRANGRRWQRHRSQHDSRLREHNDKHARLKAILVERPRRRQATTKADRVSRQLRTGRETAMVRSRALLSAIFGNARRRARRLLQHLSPPGTTSAAILPEPASTIAASGGWECQHRVSVRGPSINRGRGAMTSTRPLSPSTTVVSGLS